MAVYAGVMLCACATSCGERTSNADVAQMSAAMSDVLVSIQSATDSLARTRIADSVARLRGYSDWTDLREAINDAAVEPERLRAILDSTQKQIESRMKTSVPKAIDSAAVN